MSQVRPDVDLGALARPVGEARPPKRSWVRVVVPLVILLAFLAVLASVSRDLLRGSVEVTVVRPTLVDSSTSAAAGAPLFQAAGWVEPDPSAIEVTALANGVVREVLVQPSDAVKAGDVVARLIDQDARLASDGAGAQFMQAKAELMRSEKEVEAARTNLDAALAVTEVLALARAELEGANAASRGRAAAIERGQAQLTIAEQEFALQNELAAAGAAGSRQVELAEARLVQARAELEGLRADAALATADVEKAKARLARAEREFELRLDDKLRLDTSLMSFELAKARVNALQVACDEALLRLKRMEVRAPAGGIVLERIASPGSKLTDDRSVVCTLYDPAHLRVRVDVPQGEVGKLGVGQQAEVLAESRAGKPYRGEVIRIVHRADIQKVTLQAHVRLADADELLRPEMLCQVKFLASASASGASSTTSQSVRIPARLLVDGDSVWVVDGASGTAKLRRVELGGTSGELVDVRSGLNVSDKLIDAGREALKDGERVKIREER